MATLNVTEYSKLATRPMGVFAFGLEPALARQSVTYTTSTQSAVFDNATHFVRLIPDADCYVHFAASPTATASSTLIKADTVEFFEVQPGQGLRVAAYDGAS
jgi:hypothetical protein